MDIQTLIEKNAAVLSAHDARVAAAEQAEREYIEQQKAEAIQEAKKLWIKLGADESEISDDGVLCVGEWAVKATAVGRFYPEQWQAVVEITPADKESALWKTLEAAEDEDFTPRVMMSWIETQFDVLIGKIASYLRDTLPKMPGIIQEKLAEVEAKSAYWKQAAERAEAEAAPPSDEEIGRVLQGIVSLVMVLAAAVANSNGGAE